MFTSFQIILVSVVTILTLLLVVIGAKIYQILDEFNKTLKKINKLLAEDEGMNFLLSLLNSGKGNGIKKSKRKKLWLKAKDVDTQDQEKKNLVAVSFQKEKQSERQRFFSHHGKTLN